MKAIRRAARSIGTRVRNFVSGRREAGASRARSSSA
nr:MAG TPA: hypothetical protein [Caudoviricetes sp.]